MLFTFPGISRPPPSYYAGYARNARESVFLELWNGLVGAWVPALGPTGLTLRDVSGYNNHGTGIGSIVAANWSVANTLRGESSYVFQHDGVDEFWEIGNHSILQPTTGLAIVFVFKSQGAGTGSFPSVVSTSGQTGSFGYFIDNDAANTRLNFYIRDSGWNIARTAIGSITQDVWYHIVATWDGATSTVYINGVASGNTASPTTIDYVSPSPTRIGHYSTTDDFHGLIASVRIYNRPFNISEIQLDYQNFLATFILRDMVVAKAPAVLLPMDSSGQLFVMP